MLIKSPFDRGIIRQRHRTERKDIAMDHFYDKVKKQFRTNDAA